MGICACSSTVEDDYNKEIDERMNNEKLQNDKIIKLLLLGAGSSGKSTILKQIRYLHTQSKGLTKEDLIQYSDIIYLNLLQIIRILIELRIKLDIKCKNKKSEISQNEIRKKPLIINMYRRDENSSDDTTNMINAFTLDTSLIETSKHKLCNHPLLMDNMNYFLNNFKRIISNNYKPTFKDILNCRMKTTGMVTEKFNMKVEGINGINSANFEIMDVGGQRNERRKWIKCFSDVTSIIFMISLAGYDQVLFEDYNTNKLTEAFDLFEDIITNKVLKEVPFIVFLNKHDLFQKKLSQGIEFNCPGYNGNKTNEVDIISWIHTTLRLKNTFIQYKSIKFHITTATNTKIIDDTFKLVQRGLVNRFLKTAGLS